MTTRLALAALVAALAFPSAAAQADNPKLIGVVGTNDAFAISLRDPAGNLVKQLEPGTYDVTVSDRSQSHNFHLKGPGVDRATSIGDVVDVTWTVTLGDGLYTYVCDAHNGIMRGYFIVGSPAPTALTGSVGPRKTITLKPKAALPGPATIVVNDRSKVDNFHLSGPGVNKKTGLRTRGKVTWDVTLSPGTYTYKSDKSKKLRGSFTVRFPA